MTSKHGKYLVIRQHLPYAGASWKCQSVAIESVSTEADALEYAKNYTDTNPDDIFFVAKRVAKVYRETNPIKVEMIC